MLRPKLLPLMLATIVATQAGGASGDLPADAKGKSVLALRVSAQSDTAELLIYGPIGDFFWDGVTASSIVAQLSAITSGTIRVRINSDGGVVQDGLAIYTALRHHAARIEVQIDGIAASIASLIASAGDVVRMPAHTMQMLHAPHASAWGNAQDLREVADVLDTFAKAMGESYVRKTGKPDEVAAVLGDGRDHWYTAAEAVDFGLADEVIDYAPAENEDTAAAAALLSYITAISSRPAGGVTAALRAGLQRTTTTTAFARLCEPHQRAVYAHLEESEMKQQCHLIMAQPQPAGDSAQPDTTTTSLQQAQQQQAPAPAAPVPAAAAGTDVAAEVRAALHERNTRLREVFAQFRDITGVRDLEASCLADTSITIEAAQQRLLARIGHGGAPLNEGQSPPAPGTGAPSVTAGIDQRDRDHERIVSGILARANLLNDADAAQARQGNPYARTSLISLAEASLIRAGVNTRNLTRDQIAQQVLAAQTTSDFPILLENTLHKMLLRAYRLQEFTWRRFCDVGTLSDYRPHNRYHMGSFSDLLPVNEAGEYQNGVMSDGEKETIQGRRRGRILQITPEVLVNDDLSAFTRPTQALGQAAGRTIEKDVYALFSMNGGNGPTMGDSQPLFHSSHNNIAATPAGPTVESIDAARLAMAQQKAVGEDSDYLDIVPALWLGPLSLGSKAKEINAMEYNDESQKHQRRPNVVRGLFRDVVDTVRLGGTAWYMLADPAVEPVFEVAFLDGVQTPTLEQETNFRTDGLSWKVVHRYGVGAVGWRGIHRNAGSGG